MAIKFNDLPQPVRERFVHLTLNAERDPRVLVFNKAFGGAWVPYVLGVGSIVAMGVMLDYTIRRGQILSPTFDKETYLAFGGAVAVLILCISSIVFRFIWKPPPYREGMYALTSYLVRASGGELEMMSIADIGTPTIVTVRRNGAHVHTRLELGGPFTFYYSSDAQAQAGWARIAAARATFRAMMAARDAAAIATVDPFVDCTVSGQWVVPNQPPHPPQAVSVPTALKIGRWAGAIVFGLATAGVYFAIIDSVFEEERSSRRNPLAPLSAPTARPRPRR